MVVNTLKALSLFSGAGGMDVGVRQAGFDVLACVETDPHCCDTLRDTIIRKDCRTQVVEEDICKVEPAKMMSELGLIPKQLDLLFGGPPCQAFSQIGKRMSLEDERGQLLFQMVRFANILRPKAILIEQVKGLLNAPDEHGKAGGVLDRLTQQLADLNYVPKWRVVSAAEYGVPQLRERVFIVSIFKSNDFQFPIPTHGKPQQAMNFFGLPPYRTVGDFLKDLPLPVTKGEELPLNSHYDVTPEGDRRRIHGVGEGSHLARELHLPIEQRCTLSKKDTTKFRRLSRTEPSLTLRCGEIFYHPVEDRYLTPREYMRLHGYPDDYYLKGPIRGRSGQVKNLDQHRQVANSVPPPVAYQIAQSIRKVLECQPLSLKSSATQ